MRHARCAMRYAEQPQKTGMKPVMGVAMQGRCWTCGLMMLMMNWELFFHTGLWHMEAFLVQLTDQVAGELVSLYSI